MIWQIVAGLVFMLVVVYIVEKVSKHYKTKAKINDRLLYLDMWIDNKLEV